MNGEMDPFSRRVLRASGIVAVVTLTLALVVFDGRVLLVLLTGVLLALSLAGTSASVARRVHVPYGAVLALTVLASVTFLALGSYSLGAGILAQAHALFEELARAWGAFVEAVRRQPALARFAGSPGAVAPGPPALEPGRVLGSARAALGGLSELLGGAAVVFFLGVYGAVRPDDYPQVVLQLVPPRHAARAGQVLHEAATQLRRWMLGRIVAMAFVGIFATLGLALLKIPLALPLGILAGLLTFVEYLGAVASAAPACLIAFTAGPTRALAVIVLYAAAHVIEGYGLTPLLTRRTVYLPPAYTLAAQALLGSIYGIAGLTLATPVVIVLTVLVRRLYVDSLRPVADG